MLPSLLGDNSDMTDNRIIGSDATNSMRKPFSTAKVFIASSGDNGFGGGSLNFSSTFSGPAFLE